MILSMCSGSSWFCFLPFSKCSVALMNNTSSGFLHFFKTKIHTGMPVEKNRLAGRPITVSIWPSFSSLVRMRASEPLLTSTPCGRMMAITPSCSRK
ncbi:hypothetical protein D3C84_1157170 [compost metagenome]